jgi:hypothetical protein
VCNSVFMGSSLATSLRALFDPARSVSVRRDCIGDSAIAGDLRWAGTFGVNVDFVARCHCSVEYIANEDIEVLYMGSLPLAWAHGPNVHWHPQDILEKFEFFPVKCRIQRAQEIAQVRRELEESEQSKTENSFRIKVFSITIQNAERLLSCALTPAWAHGIQEGRDCSQRHRCRLRCLGC